MLICPNAHNTPFLLIVLQFYVSLYNIIILFGKILKIEDINWLYDVINIVMYKVIFEVPRSVEL